MSENALVHIDPNMELPQVDFGQEPDDPQERVRQRLMRLTRSFAEVLATIAQMHKDEDWRYVSRPDGTPYGSLAELLRDHMGISVAMARRYVQGARDIYLPLQELVVQGTPIKVTAGDVAKLGQDGAREVVDGVKASLTGDESPQEAAQVISDTVDEVKERRQQEKQAAHDDIEGWAQERHVGMSGGGESAAQSEWDSVGDDRPTPSKGAATVSGADAYADLGGDDDDYEPASGSTGAATSAAGLSVDGDFESVMSGARAYETEADCAELEPELGEVANAVRVLAAMDCAQIAELVSFDTRGVVLGVDEAVTRLYRLRTSVESSPWFLEHIV